MIEVSLGGDLTAAAEADEWAEAFENGEKKTTSCCPAFVHMIRKHFPTLSGNISTTVSPMCAVSRLIKEQEPDAVTVFIGPCQAKKSEIMDSSIRNNADYVLTFDEAVEMLRGKDIELEPAESYSQQGSVYGKRFGNSAGVTAAVLQCLKEQGIDASELAVKVEAPRELHGGHDLRGRVRQRPVETEIAQRAEEGPGCHDRPRRRQRRP